jgi:SurA N-terminal domain
MRRHIPRAVPLRAGIIVGVLALVVVARSLSGCGAPSTVAARVGGTTISIDRVDGILDHARTEAKREGKHFPVKGTPEYHALRRQALDLLVYHEELAQRAATLGIVLSSADFQQPAGARRVELPGFEPEGGLSSVFVLESRREAILYRKIYERVSRDVTVTPAEISAYYRQHPNQYPRAGLTRAAAREEIRRNLLDTKRNALMARWIAQMRRYYEGKVEYGPAFRSQ